MIIMFILSFFWKINGRHFAAVCNLVYESLVPILAGHSEIGAHVVSEIGNLIW